MSKIKTKLKVGSLFAGVGGFDLGFERAGFELAWSVEVDPHCQAILKKQFPNAKIFGDIREVDAILHLVRCFNDENISHVENRINPISDAEIINMELMLRSTGNRFVNKIPTLKT